MGREVPKVPKILEVPKRTKECWNVGILKKLKTQNPKLKTFTNFASLILCQSMKTSTTNG
jgi:hypothetical protein